MTGPRPTEAPVSETHKSPTPGLLRQYSVSQIWYVGYTRLGELRLMWSPCPGPIPRASFFRCVWTCLYPTLSSDVSCALRKLVELHSLPSFQPASVVF